MFLHTPTSTHPTLSLGYKSQLFKLFRERTMREIGVYSVSTICLCPTQGVLSLLVTAHLLANGKVLAEKGPNSAVK